MKKIDLKIIIILLLIVIIILGLNIQNKGRYQITGWGYKANNCAVVDTKTGEVKRVSSTRSNQYGIKFKDMKINP